MIPSDATAVHGISNEMVADQPKFSEIAQELCEWMDGCDLAGYNSNTFDVPMLCEEFGRCEIKWPNNNARLIDVLTIERHINSHKLSATYQRYT
jgi:DNA polymerase III subunit epsilon